MKAVIDRVTNWLEGEDSGLEKVAAYSFLAAVALYLAGHVVRIL